MAALRRLMGFRSNISTSLSKSSVQLIPQSLLIPRRGIATKLFVAGLSFYTSEQGLSEAFSKYGQVVEAKLVTDRMSNRSKGFGFVTFASEDEAHNALYDMNGKHLDGRVIYVDYAKPTTRSDGQMPIATGPPEQQGDN